LHCRRAATGFQQSDAERERLERVDDILKALGVRDGLQIADIGSADGFYTVRIARGVHDPALRRSETVTTEFVAQRVHTTRS
jgi:hypothetical protein